MNFLAGLWKGAKLLIGAETITGTNGADNAVTIAKGIGGFIDEQKFTSEEQAVHNAGLIDKFQGFLTTTFNESSVRSQTRRDLAILIMMAEIRLIVLAVVVWPFNVEYAKFILLIVGINGTLGVLAMGVAAFFFGTHITRAMKGQ